MSTTKSSDDGSCVYTQIVGADHLTNALLGALSVAEMAHMDNTQAPCDARVNREHCCRYCSTAEAIRVVLRDELDINAHWEGGRTVIRAAKFKHWTGTGAEIEWDESPDGVIVLTKNPPCPNGCGEPSAVVDGLKINLHRCRAAKEPG